MPTFSASLLAAQSFRRCPIVAVVPDFLVAISSCNDTLTGFLLLLKVLPSLSLKPTGISHRTLHIDKLCSLSYTIISFLRGRAELVAKQEPKLLRVGAAAHELGLHPMTVRRWIQAGRIQVVPMGREVRIPRTEIERMVGKMDGRLLILYARVSGHGQKTDLETQLQRLQTWATTERKGIETLVLSDIGSGLKAGRRHLQRLLKLVCEDKVAEVAITYEDRLTRFGQEYLETLFACFGVTLTVLEPGEEKTPEQELTDDLLALIASFSGRLYGMRSHKQKELLQCAQAVLSNP